MSSFHQSGGRLSIFPPMQQVVPQGYLSCNGLTITKEQAKQLFINFESTHTRLTLWGAPHHGPHRPRTVTSAKLI